MHFFGFYRIYMHPAFFVFLLSSFLSPSFRFYRYAVLFCALHEGFHALGAACLGVPARGISFYPYGCKLHLASCDAKNGAMIAALGPLGSFFLFLLYPHGEIGKINLSLFLFNLLPALPLDGGRILRFFLLRRIGTYYVRKRLRCFGIITSALLFLSAALLPSLSCAAVALLLLFYKPSPEVAPFSAHKKAVSGLKCHIFSIKPDDSLLRLCRRFSPFYYAYFFLPEKGLLFSEDDIIRTLSQNAAARAASLLSPALPPCSGGNTPIMPE